MLGLKKTQIISRRGKENKFSSLPSKASCDFMLDILAENIFEASYNNQ